MKEYAEKSCDKWPGRAKQGGNDTEIGDYVKEELEFAVFCIENVAARLGVDGTVIYDAFAKKSDILNSYVIPCYDVLHTQGKEYIVNDLIDMMREKGVTV